MDINDYESMNFLAEQNIQLREQIKDLKYAMTDAIKNLESKFINRIESLQKVMKTHVVEKDEVSVPHKKELSNHTNPKVVIIGDSVALNVDKKSIEKVTKKDISLVKAYSSSYSQHSKWPNKNVKEVTKSLLDSEVPEHLILGAPSVDITDLDTAKNNEDEYDEKLKRAVAISCQNMFSTAESAIKAHPRLQRVTLLQHLPRYDTADVDPFNLKPQLAKYANSIYQQLLEKSLVKEKLSIGKLSLDCEGKIRQARFTRLRDGWYDGVFMHGTSGRNVYSRSLAAIIARNSSERKRIPLGLSEISGEQSQPVYNVAVSNQFQILGNL